MIVCKAGVSPKVFLPNLQSNSLRNMSRTCTPHERILEAVLDTPMDLVADILDGAVVADNESFAEVRINSLPLRVDPNEMQLIPAAIDDFADTEIELAAHNDCVWFTR